MRGRGAATAQARDEIAPRKKVRAAINLANPLLVSGRNEAGDPIGVAPSMAAALAAALGVELELLPYKSPSDISDQVNADEWDIALIGTDPAREEAMAFSPPYVEIAASYLVAQDSPVVDSAEVDVDGATIIAVDRSAYDLWLRANLQHASLEHVPDDAAGMTLFRERPGHVLAGLRPTLAAHRAKLSGARILGGHFMTVEQAIATRKTNLEAARYLRQFVDHAVGTGLVLRLLRQFGVDSLIRVPRQEPPLGTEL